ncbi:MAG: helix-turn-helix transcriptional regulator [Chloroflexota bacterium]
MPAGIKRDRTARLLRVEHLLYQHPRGLKPRELADLCGVCVRTAYRDLRALEGELALPLWQDDDGHYGINLSHFLPPLKLTLVEATALFVAARLACRYSDERDPALEAAFAKLATVLPPPVAQHVQQTVAAMSRKPHNESQARVFDLLATAWAARRTVRIWYRRIGDGQQEVNTERLLDPYFVEPSAVGHACYVIGHDHSSGEVRTFKVERIRGIELTGAGFDVPEDWSAGAYLQGAWGVMHDEEAEVRVRFAKAVAARVKESIWHPSQTLADEADGSLLFTVRVAGILEIARWLLTWGAEAEVLSPPALRDYLADAARGMAALYGSQ